jgi:diaminopimelate decarboxylase
VSAKGDASGAGYPDGPGASRGDVPPQEETSPQPITLIDETGRERQFQLHDAFDHEGAVYYLVENIDDPSQVLLLREAGGGLETVEGEEFQRVIAALEEDRVE